MVARADSLGRVGTPPRQDEVAQEYGLPLPGDRWAVQMRACDSEARNRWEAEMELMSWFCFAFPTPRDHALIMI